MPVNKASLQGLLKPGYMILRHEVDGYNEVPMPKHTWVIYHQVHSLRQA